MFAKLLNDRLPEGIEETWVLESSWAPNAPGRCYYDIHLANIERYETALPIFKRFLGDGGYRVLEGGCGTGRWMALFEALGNSVFGVDHSLEQLRFAKDHAPEFQLSVGDVLRVPFRANSFDAVFSSYVAEHFRAGPGASLREAHRVLKPGGLLFCVVPFASAWRRLIVHPFLRIIYVLWRLRGGGLQFAEYHFRRGEVEKAVRENGFRILETHPDDFRAPWSKGLWCDAVDVLSFMNVELARPFRFGKLGTLVVRLASRLPLWWYCEGIFVVARCEK